jgi:hypothetical protein
MMVKEEVKKTRTRIISGEGEYREVYLLHTLEFKARIQASS